DTLEKQVSQYREELDRLEEERAMLRTEVDSLSSEYATTSTILMQIIGHGMDKHGRVPPKIDQQTVDRFLDGERVDIDNL
ncbi:hypothetical protein IW137_004200, partial [Coemansia sp. RSA 1287]